MCKPNIPKSLLSDSSIQLRLINFGDLELIRHWRNRSDIRVWFNDTNPIAIDQHLAWYDTYRADPRDLMFLVTSSAQMVPVGTVALYCLDFEKMEAQFGRLMIAECRDEGLGWAAAHRACIVGFSGLGLHFLKLAVKQSNLVALRIYERLGFRTCSKTQDDLLEMRLDQASFCRVKI